MRVTPTVSKLDTALETPGVAAPAIDTQTMDTTIIAQDGETVAIGGLIKHQDVKAENKVPWFGDLPWVGTLFRYRSQLKTKQELLIILTPHIVRNRFERDRILAMEGARMDWTLSDIVRTHGISGMDPLFPLPHGIEPPAPPPPLPSPNITPPLEQPTVAYGTPQPVAPAIPVPSIVPGGIPVLPAPVAPVPPDGVLPAPRRVPPGSTSYIPASPLAPVANAPGELPPVANAPGSGVPVESTTWPGGTVPAESVPATAGSNQGKESRR